MYCKPLKKIHLQLSGRVLRIRYNNNFVIIEHFDKFELGNQASNLFHLYIRIVLVKKENKLS